MILEAIFNGEIYPAETVVPKSEKFREAGQAIADIMRYFEQTLSKEDYAKLDTPPKGCALRSAESPLQGADDFRSLLQSYRGSYTSPALALPTTPLWTCRRGTIASNHSPTTSEYPPTRPY